MGGEETTSMAGLPALRTGAVENLSNQMRSSPARRGWPRRLGRVLVLMLLVSAEALAQRLPPVNLGQSSFLDGGPVPSGWFLQEVADYYTANVVTGPDGKEAPFDFDVDIFVLMNHLIYIDPDRRLLGARVGVEVLLPFVFPSLNPGTSPLLNDTGGVGDLILGGLLLWDPVLRADGKPLFVNRMNLVGSLPTGRYSEHDDINPGNNFATFNPYWAATLFPFPHWEISWRLHYLWSAENDEPNARAFPGARRTQAGQALHANFAVSREIRPRLRIGMNGYVVKQISDAEIDGRDISDSKEQVLAVGPGAWLALGPKSVLIFGAYFETLAENRLEGDRFVLRFFHRF